MNAQKTLNVIGLLAAVFSLRCASEGSQAIETELRRLDSRVGEGVEKIERALLDPNLTSSELGAGVRIVERSASALAAFEDDERANDVQQLMAIVYQARAWDDVAMTFAATPPPPGLDAARQVLLSAILDEKALPARLSAKSAYERALERACHSGLEHLPVFQEIVDGASRYEGAVSLDRRCTEQ